MPVLLGLVMVANPADSSEGLKAERPSVTSRWAGWSLLGAEYLLGAAAASHYWWNSGVGRNPLKNIGEDEPYVEDKLWHLWNGENLTDAHYWAFRNCCGRESPWLAMGMTLLTLTSIELLDASNLDGYWKLSLYDEAAGAAGILLWYAKHRWPGKVPLEVRVGVRQWGKTRLLLDRLAHYPQEREKQTFSHLDDYAILKTEVILRPKGYFYFGGAASLKSDRYGHGLQENLFGATVGFDVTRYLADKRSDRWTPVFNVIGRYFSTSVGYTHWFQ